MLSPLNPSKEFDAHKVQPIVESLVQNALDAMPEGGTLTIELTQEADQAVLRIGEKEIVGRFDPNDAPKEGEEMALSVDMTRACLFDPATERLIARAQ